MQAIRSYSTDSSWALGLDFYPEPGFLTIALNSQGSLDFFKGKQKLKVVAHPVQLYLKAHFLNARLDRAEFDSVGILRLHFQETGKILHLEFGRDEVKVLAEVASRRPYRQTLRLARLEATLAPDEVIPPPPLFSPESKKHERLLVNIRADVAQAEHWVERFGSIWMRLRDDPSLWKRPSEWPPEERAMLDEEIREGRLPPFSGASTGKALDLIFHLRRRTERKIAGGRARLKKVEAQGAAAPKMLRPVAVAEPAPNPRLPRKKPGIWVEIKPELWARVGRSASENEELFRQARDRDLWFHVRGSAGAHVWIPRGQPGFGAKSEASDDLLGFGCQLALINSKSVKSGSAVVDYTERRHLRRIRSAAGQVEILRSETRHVRLDEAFERKIMHRET